MFKLPKELREKEILYQRLILFFLGLGAVVLYFPQILNILATLTWICLPFITGGIIAFILNTMTGVIIRFLQRLHPFELSGKVEIGFKIFTLFLLFFILLFVGASVIPQLISSVERFIANAPVEVVRIYQNILEWARQYPEVYDWLLTNRETFLNSSDWISSVFNYITIGTIGEALKSISAALSGTFASIWIVFISILFSFVSYFNTRRLREEGKLIAQAYMSRAVYVRFKYILDKTARVFSHYLGGTLLEAIILTTVVALLNYLLGIPYPLLIAVACGIGGLIPMFGATIVAAVCALCLCFVNPFKGLLFFVVFILWQQLEGNFIYPNVVGKTIGLPSMFVLIAITVGAALAGILGIVLSIPITTVIYQLIFEDAKARVEEKEKEKEV